MSLKSLVLVQSGERTSANGKAVANKILLAIPDMVYRTIRPYLEHVALPRYRSLHEPNEMPQFVYFPNSGLLSLVVVSEYGIGVEAGRVWKEGIVGLVCALG